MAGYNLRFLNQQAAATRSRILASITAPLWEPIPVTVRPTDFVGKADTTIDDVRAFLDAAGVQVHSAVSGEHGNHLILSTWRPYHFRRWKAAEHRLLQEDDSR